MTTCAGRHAERERELSLAMAVMQAMAPGRTWSMQEIADVTGMSIAGVWTAERRALMKLLKRLDELGIAKAADAKIGPKWYRAQG